MFKKILIANRGEIACRIIKTVKRLGIKAVVVYSSADTQATHVKLADEAFCIGPAPAQESYLNGAAIIQAAKEAGAEAIHPGYGFLSENADFAARCQESGFCFIGPSPEAIQAMGEKDHAKQIMQAAGVPVIPGSNAENQHPTTLQAAATQIGYPVLIKATAGGGGKGVRVVNQATEFAEYLAQAKSEAKASFGNDRVLIEKYLQQARHIEVQIFADTHGHVVYLFERDCSIQRRLQKIIEEAPASGVSGTLRQALGEAAVQAARAIHYEGAGTVEFLLDADQQFYFMEMNTRLQVEHPITEMITGLDLVEWQIRVAFGENLPITRQNELHIKGHAIEARIYAENPRKNFMPATGVLKHCQFPQENSQVRVDTGVQAGDKVSIYYDPLLAKLIAWGDDREMAIAQLTQALTQVQINGVHTNLALLKAIVQYPAFVQAKITSNFIAIHHKDLLCEPRLTATSELANSPWNLGDSWRLNLPAPQYNILQERSLNDHPAHAAETDSAQHVLAPMPSRVAAVFIQPGQMVRKGERLLMLEAMKMQHTLYAPIDGTIKELLFKPDDLVEEGAQLIVWDLDPADRPRDG